MTDVPIYLSTDLPLNQGLYRLCFSNKKATVTGDRTRAGSFYYNKRLALRANAFFLGLRLCSLRRSAAECRWGAALPSGMLTLSVGTNRETYRITAAFDPAGEALSSCPNSLAVTTPWRAQSGAPMPRYELPARVIVGGNAASMRATNCR